MQRYRTRGGTVAPTSGASRFNDCASSLWKEKRTRKVHLVAQVATIPADDRKIVHRR